MVRSLLANREKWGGCKLGDGYHAVCNSRDSRSEQGSCGMAETRRAMAEAMAEATSADFIVGWRMGNAWGGDGCAVEVVD